MRTFELILFILIIAIFICQLYRAKNLSIVIRFLLLASLVISILQLLLEGYRWQMAGIYFVFFIQLIMQIAFYHSKKTYHYIKSKKASNIILVTILTFSFILSIMFPVYKMEEPSGIYSVGTMVFETIDHSRIELYGNSETTDRRLKYQIWYPSDNIDNYQKAPWLLEGVEVSKGISKMLTFPTFILNQTKYNMTNSYLNALVSTQKQQYPVVIISHGWQGFRALHTDLAENLASNGYIVISIDHTYGSAITVFNDGTIFYSDSMALNDTVDEKTFTDSSNLLVTTYSKDISFIIDKLSILNNENKVLAHSLNLEQIGLLGHSTGGGAGVLTAINDNRIKSLIGLDAWVEPIKDDDIKKGLAIPSFFFRSEQWEDKSNNVNLYSLIEHSSNNLGLYQINNTNHIDFSMAYVFSPFSKYIGMTGSINREISIQLQNDIILDFFNSTLINHENSLHELNKYSDYMKLVLEGK